MAPRENLSCSSAGAEPQPILYKDGISTILGQVIVSPVSHGPCMLKDSELSAHYLMEE